MTPPVPLPDVEALVIAYLIADAGVTEVVDGRVYGELPEGFVAPCLVVHRAGGPVIVDELFDGARIQVESLGTSWPSAWAAIAAARVAMGNRQIRGVHPLGVVTGSQETLGPQEQPDQINGRPRYISERLVYVHPSPDG